MKILVVCQHFFPETFRVNDICYELVKRGHDVTVLTGLPNYPKGKVFKEYKWFKNRNQIINGVKIKRCSLIGRRSSTVMMGINYMWFAVFGCIKAFFMKKNFDIVYVYQLSPISMVWPGIVVKKMKKIPLIVHCLDQWPISVTTGPISKKSLLYSFLYKMSVWTYNKADQIIISSKSFKDYFINELHIGERNKGLIYYPSYAESDYENVGSLDNGVFDIVFAGNIGPAQSVETIIETANLLKENKNIIFHIVGDGLSREKCEKLKTAYDLDNVIFYGYHEVSKMREFYQLADCFIITMVDNEVVNSTLPAKLQSYMLAGKPIVGAISGEVKNVIDDAHCGYCCDSGDYEKLAKIILALMIEKDNLEIFSKNANNYYQMNFTKEKCIQNLVTIFENQIKV
ncbi:MAG: glycosyltransferase family 4 protein [Bacilli bacterium]